MIYDVYDPSTTLPKYNVTGVDNEISRIKAEVRNNGGTLILNISSDIIVKTTIDKQSITLFKKIPNTKKEYFMQIRFNDRIDIETARRLIEGQKHCNNGLIALSIENFDTKYKFSELVSEIYVCNDTYEAVLHDANIVEFLYPNNNVVICCINRNSIPGNDNIDKTTCIIDSIYDIPMNKLFVLDFYDEFKLRFTDAENIDKPHFVFVLHFGLSGQKNLFLQQLEDVSDTTNTIVFNRSILFNRSMVLTYHYYVWGDKSFEPKEV